MTTKTDATATTPRFDADLSPGQTNRAATKAHGLRYVSVLRCYVDNDGCPVLDRYGQQLG